MCSFVQSELDCLLPGGERLMVLVSSHAEMDSSTKRSVSRMYSVCNMLLKPWLHFEEACHSGAEMLILPPPPELEK